MPFGGQVQSKLLKLLLLLLRQETVDNGHVPFPKYLWYVERSWRVMYRLFVISLTFPCCFLSLSFTQSRKQGPSHRKVRRWRNDHLEDAAVDHPKAAEALRKAKEHAHLYRDIIQFREAPVDPLTRYVQVAGG